LADPTLAVVVLGAGRGSRLRPLTDILPKPLCPVGNRALLDWAVERVGHLGDVAVNVHHGRAAMEDHLRRLRAHRGVHVSIEEDEALGTAGAVGKLRDWLDGRAVVVANSDAWGVTQASVDRLLAGWNGSSVRVLVAPQEGHEDFPGVVGRFAGVSVMPWAAAAALAPVPSGLYEAVWSRTGVEVVETDEPFFDCGTPAEYLAANLAWSGGESVVGDGAVVEGELVRSVVWPGGVVARGERLVECIRVGRDVTVPG